MQLGLSLSLPKGDLRTPIYLNGAALPGQTLSVDSPDRVYALMDNGDLLIDNGDILAYGAVEGAYQWYINDIPVEGANDIFFTVPEYAVAGDRIRCNGSQAVFVTAMPFAIISSSYTAITREIQSGSDLGLVTVGDQVFSRTQPTEVVSDYEFNYKIQGNTESDVWSFASSNTAVATVDQTSGYVTWQSNGSAIITASIGDASYTYSLSLSSNGGSPIDTFVQFETGSVANDASNAVDSRISAKYDPGVNLKIYNSQNHTSQVYVRNPDLWCADLDLTCISPWNSSGGAQRALTLISPRHVIMAAHYEAAVGCTVRFVKMDGTVVNRTMTARLRHPSYSPYYPDISIGVLDSDVPSGISFAKILPDGWQTKLPSLASANARIPTIGLDQEEKATVQDIYQLNTIAGFFVPIAEKRLSLYENKIVGDSGNPAFMIINNELVILTVWTYGGAGSGTAIHDQRSAINTMMTSLGGGYTLTDINLNSYNNYTLL